MKKLSSLFENNKSWAENIKKEQPDFFKELAKGQKPDYLWIGCSDSRVPPNQIVDLAPGNLFVHRNVANLIVHSDLNSQSVIQYAVEVLQVKHVVVCGHYGCGGVTAAMQHQNFGLIDNWLLHIKDVYQQFEDELSAITDEEEKINRFCELNVQAQVSNICHNSFVQNAWKNGQELSVHGLIYSLSDGLLKDLEISVHSDEETPSIY